MNIKEVLQNKYNNIANMLMHNSVTEINIQQYVAKILDDFMKKHVNVAIYCGGYHTDRLFADYVFELRNIKIIIDNNPSKKTDKGYKIISDDEIENNEIDGIIISTFRYRNEIIQLLEKKHSKINYLDIYGEIEKRGIKCTSEYYSDNPYEKYKEINEKSREIKENGESEKALTELLWCYLQIKDIRSAVLVAERLYKFRRCEINNKLLREVKELFLALLEGVENIDKENIVLLCLDGFRRDAFESDYFKEVFECVSKRGCVYTNAYAYSTSTNESLLPAFSRDYNAGNRNQIEEEECQWIREAHKLGKIIYAYTDSYQFINDEKIHYTMHSQTITQKIWDFVIDSNDSINNGKGVFYLHELYESHFSFANPYSTNEIEAKGTAMLFDFLPQNGGRLKVDYKQQYIDSIKYLNDTLSPILERLKCRYLIFADHGNMILEKGRCLENVQSQYYVAAEELLRIPFVVSTPEIKKGFDSTLLSLMDINDILVAMMNKRGFFVPKREYIRIGRNELYNPCFRDLYNIAGKSRYLQAFVGKIYGDGRKELEFSDGYRETWKNGFCGEELVAVYDKKTD